MKKIMIGMMAIVCALSLNSCSVDDITIDDDKNMVVSAYQVEYTVGEVNNQRKIIGSVTTLVENSKKSVTIDEINRLMQKEADIWKENVYAEKETPFTFIGHIYKKESN